MAEPTLQQVFGANVAQDSAMLYIDKADLTSLTASDTNTAESLLVGIILLAKNYLTQIGFNDNIDQSIYISNGFPAFTNRGANNDSYRTDQLIVNLAKIDTNSVIDPNSY